MSFGSRLREARNNKGLSQKDLADKIDVTNTAISNYEKDISFPNTPILYRLFEILDCDANFLFQDEVVKFRSDDYMVLSKHEKQLITDFRSLSEQGQDYILQTMDLVKDKYKKDIHSPFMERVG